MTTRSAALLLTVLPSIPFLFGQELRSAAVAQAPAAGQTTSAESLRQIIPGHFMSSAFTAGRPFSGGIIVTSEGAVVVDALGSEAVGRAQRESITSVIEQPVRYLVSSSFHNRYQQGEPRLCGCFQGRTRQLSRGPCRADATRRRVCRRAAVAPAERNFSRSHDAARRRKGNSDSLFRPGPYDGRLHRVRAAGPNCLSERAVLLRGVSEHGAGLRRFVAASARRSPVPRGRYFRAGSRSPSG